jgi:putative transposase
VNAKKIRRLMREHALNPRQRRRFIATTDSDHNYPIFPNLASGVGAIQYERPFFVPLGTRED